MAGSSSRRPTPTCPRRLRPVKSGSCSSSAMGHGQQTLFAYDSGAGAWQQLGGGGTPLELSGGAIIYPKSIFENRDSAEPLTNAQSVPEVVGDTLFFRTGMNHPVLKAVAIDTGNGPVWREYRPNHLASSTPPTGRADYGGPDRRGHRQPVERDRRGRELLRPMGAGRAACRSCAYMAGRARGLVHHVGNGDTDRARNLAR